jgi:hypothetical protein
VTPPSNRGDMPAGCPSSLMIAIPHVVTATPAVLVDSRGLHPWLQGAPPGLVAAVAAEVVSWSNQLQPACERLGIPCFDVGNDFDRALGLAAGRVGPERIMRVAFHG